MQFVQNLSMYVLNISILAETMPGCIILQSYNSVDMTTKINFIKYKKMTVQVYLKMYIDTEK